MSIEFVYHLLLHHLVDSAALIARVHLLPVGQSQKDQCIRRWQRIQKRIKRENK